MANIHRGKRFERVAAQLLSKLTGEKWVRTPQSGAYSTIHKSFENMSGDLVCKSNPDKYDFVVECKMRKNPILLEDFINPASELQAWIKKLANVDWLIVFKAEKKHWVYFISNKYEILSEKIGVKTHSICGFYFSCIRLRDIK